MKDVVFSNIVKRFESQEHLRIVVFGASNTERHMPSVHWSDVLEVGLRARYGRKFQIINAGGSGNNTREALARFERDVLFYQPDIVIVTFGGNDCNLLKEKFVPESEFVENLTTIVNTHDMASVRNIGEQILFIHEGHAAWTGTSATLDTDPNPILHEFFGN